MSCCWQLAAEQTCLDTYIKVEVREIEVPYTLEIAMIPWNNKIWKAVHSLKKKREEEKKAPEVGNGHISWWKSFPLYKVYKSSWFIGLLAEKRAVGMLKLELGGRYLGWIDQHYRLIQWSREHRNVGQQQSRMLLSQICWIKPWECENSLKISHPFLIKLLHLSLTITTMHCTLSPYHTRS